MISPVDEALSLLSFGRDFLLQQFALRVSRRKRIKIPVPELHALDRLIARYGV